MNPMHENRGLCLASTAIQKGDLSALASPTDTSRYHDKVPVSAHQSRTPCEQTALPSTENVLPLHGVLAGNPAVQLERNHVGEPSLSAEAECLSLQAQDSTPVQNSQIAKERHSSPCVERRGLLPQYAETCYLFKQLLQWASET